METTVEQEKFRFAVRDRISRKTDVNRDSNKDHENSLLALASTSTKWNACKWHRLSSWFSILRTYFTSFRKTLHHPNHLLTPCSLMKPTHHTTSEGVILGNLFQESTNYMTATSFSVCCTSSCIDWQFSTLITGRNAGIKITFVSLFWFHRPVGATLCTDYRQIWQGRGGRQHLTHCQSWKFSGVIWEITAQKTWKKG